MMRAFRLVVFLLAHHALHPSAAMRLFSDAVSVAATEPPLFDGDDGRVKTLFLLIEWAARESAGLKRVVGKNGDCGRMQLLYPPSLKGHTCEELKKDGTLDLELGLAWMRDMKKVCGSPYRAAVAYARGSCDHKDGRVIVKFRFDEIEIGIQ